MKAPSDLQVFTELVNDSKPRRRRHATLVARGEHAIAQVLSKRCQLAVDERSFCMHADMSVNPALPLTSEVTALSLEFFHDRPGTASSRILKNLRDNPLFNFVTKDGKPSQAQMLLTASVVISALDSEVEGPPRCRSLPTLRRLCPARGHEDA